MVAYLRTIWPSIIKSEGNQAHIAYKRAICQPITDQAGCLLEGQSEDNLIAY